LSSLYYSIQGVNAAPTAAQKEHLAELEPRADGLINETESLINDRMTKLNELLRQNNGPVVIFAKSK
jgi:hypothetical protein